MEEENPEYKQNIAKNQKRAETFINMMTELNPSVQQMDVRGNNYAVVYIVTIPSEKSVTDKIRSASNTEGVIGNMFWGINLQKRESPIMKYACKLLFSPSPRSSIQSISISVSPGMNVTKSLTSLDAVRLEGERCAALYRDTVINGWPICPDIATVLQYQSQNIEELFRLLPIQSNIKQQLIEQIQRNNLITTMIVMEFVEGYNHTAEIRSLLTLDTFIPSAIQETNNIYMSSIAQILIAVISDNGNLFNVDNHRGNILTSRLKNEENQFIYITKIIDMGLCFYLQQIIELISSSSEQTLLESSLPYYCSTQTQIQIPTTPELSTLNDALDRINQNTIPTESSAKPLATAQTVIDLKGEYIKVVQLLANKIKTGPPQVAMDVSGAASGRQRNKYNMTNKNLCEYILQPFLLICQFVFELKFGWLKSNVNWVVDFISSFQQIDRSIVTGLEQQMKDTNTSYEIINNAYNEFLKKHNSGRNFAILFKDKEYKSLIQQMTSSKLKLKTLKTRIRCQNINDILSITDAYPINEINAMIQKFMIIPDPNNTFTKENVDRAVTQGLYYTNGVTEFPFK
jgi:hypothetical protein